MRTLLTALLRVGSCLSCGAAYGQPGRRELRVPMIAMLPFTWTAAARIGAFLRALSCSSCDCPPCRRGDCANCDYYPKGVR